MRKIIIIQGDKRTVGFEPENDTDKFLLSLNTRLDKLEKDIQFMVTCWKGEAVGSPGLEVD